MIVVEVDAECNITYADGTTKTCEHRPSFTFAECGPGYGPNRGCAKYDYNHPKKITPTDAIRFLKASIAEMNAEIERLLGLRDDTQKELNALMEAQVASMQDPKEKYLKER